MDVNINSDIMQKVIDMANEMGETLDDYVKRALLTQLQIDNVVLEDDVYPESETYKYPVLKSQAMSIKKVLEDKGLTADIIVDPQNRSKQYIKTNIKPKDFNYIVSLKDLHKMTIRLPMADMSDVKLEQLSRMYNATAFTYRNDWLDIDTLRINIKMY